MSIETATLGLTIALVLDAFVLIALILIQQGKGASIGAAFGSGASQTLFGSAGASSFLNTLTTWLAVGFFLISLGLAWTAREHAERLGTVGIPEIEALAESAQGADAASEAVPTLKVEPVLEVVPTSAAAPSVSIEPVVKVESAPAPRLVIDAVPESGEEGMSGASSQAGDVPEVPGEAP